MSQTALPITTDDLVGEEALAAYIDAKELVTEQVRPKSLVMALMMSANPLDVKKAQDSYPWIWEELKRRRFAVNGRLPGEEGITIDNETEPDSDDPRPLRTGAEDPALADRPTKLNVLGRQD